MIAEFTVTQWKRCNGCMLFDLVSKIDLKMICNDFFVVTVNCWSHVLNIIQPIWILRNTKR